MKLLYVTAEMPYGSGEVFIIEEIRELLRRGHDVRVVPRSPGAMAPHAPDLMPATIREPLVSKAVWKAAAPQLPRRLRSISRVLRGGARDSWKNAAVVPKALWLARLAAESGTNHIHCHWAGTTATMAMLAAEIAGVPWSFTAHRSDIAGNNLLAEKVRSARFARVISHSGVQMMMARGVPASPKIRVLHLGVRLPSVPPQPAVARPPVVLCPADFLPVKGHRYLMDAWRIFESRGMAGELWLVGRGDARSVIEKPPANVKVVGELNNPALLDLYRTGAIAATVLASIDLGNGEHEGIPAALMEAMSFAVPVVATNTGGIPELVTRGSGLLVREKNPAALADAIAAVVGNPELAAQLGRAGRRRVAEAFDVTEIASQLEGWFEATCPTTQNNQRDRSLTLPAQKRTC